MNDFNSSFSKIIQQVLYKFFKLEGSSQVFTEEDPIWQIVGTVESDITDGSVNHDQYIYGILKR